MAKNRRRFLCLDCGVDTGKIGEHYMLVDRVWFSVTDSNRGMLCVGCIEKRLGRRLNANDFNNSYVNELGFGQVKSVRLLERLRVVVPHGAVAHSGRAIRSQRIGRGFDSLRLHLCLLIRKLSVIWCLK